jgi:type I restriction enzyme R subunit
LALAFALCAATDYAAKIRDDVAFFQAVRAVLTKRPGGSGKSASELDHAVRQILSNALVSDEVVDIFKVAGLDKPDLSILSDEFLLEVQKLPRKNLAIELLSRLLNDEIKVTRRQNVVQARMFSEMLDKALKGYHNRSIETAKVISELIEMAKEMKEARERGEKLGLSKEEVAFFDALAQNASAVDVLGNDQLMLIAREVVATIRANTTVDWTLKDSVQANLRRLVRRVLGRYGYPPDLQPTAIALVMEQARVMAEAEAA